MANSGDKSPNKSGNPGEGSSSAPKSPSQIETTHEGGGGSSPPLVAAVPPSPTRRQVSSTVAASRAEGESAKSGGSGTKEGDKGTKTLTKTPDNKGGDQGSSGEKKRPRGRPRKDGSEPGSSSRAENPKLKKPKVKFDAPAIPAPCGVCGKRFNNYKALFGHLRVHPNRDWKGAFPPPVTRPEDTTQKEDVQMAEEISSTLLTIGRRILAGEKVGSQGDSGSSAAAANAVGQCRLDVDLNIPEEIVHFPTPPESENDDDSEDEDLLVPFDDNKK